MRKKHLIILLLFITTVTFSKLLVFKYVTYGDWYFHFSNSMSEWVQLPFIWKSSGLGTPVYMLFFWPIYFMYGLIGLGGFSSNIADKILIIVPFILSFSIGSIYFFSLYLNRRISILVASFVFVFNTYFLLLSTGHLTLLLAFSLFPITLYFYVKSIRINSITFTLICSLFLGLISFVEFRAFYQIAILLFLFSLKDFFFSKKMKVNIAVLVKYVLPIILVLLLNFYWVLGLLNISSLGSGNILNRSLFGNEFMRITASFNLFHPFWTGYRPAIFQVQPVPIYLWIIPIFAFLGVFLNRRSSNVLFFGIISLLGIFLTKQVGIPFSGVYEWLFSNFPGFNVFREASKFYSLIALGYAVLIGSFIDWVWNNYARSHFKTFLKYLLTFIIIFVFVWNTKPLIFGDISTLFVERKVHNDYNLLKNYIVGQPGFFRTLWVPQLSRWSIYTNSHPIISFAKTEWACDSKTSNCNQIINRNISNEILDNSSIKYVIVPLRDISNDDDFFVHYREPRGYYRDKLDSLDYLQRIDIGNQNLIIYENKDFKPHIYSTSLNQLEYTFVNSTKYQISIKNLQSPVSLTFVESFHPDWRIRVGDFNWFSAIAEKNYFLPVELHKQTSLGYNSYNLNPKYIKNNYSSEDYIEREDGSIDIDLTLYFQSQSYVYLGFIISVFTFVLISVSLLFLFTKSLIKKYYGVK